jgi:hypothetical protein
MPHDLVPAPATLEERIASFDSSEFAQLLGMKVLEVRDGYARVMIPSSQNKNPNGVVHGGAIFPLPIMRLQLLQIQGAPIASQCQSISGSLPRSTGT